MNGPFMFTKNFCKFENYGQIVVPVFKCVIIKNNTKYFICP